MPAASNAVASSGLDVMTRSRSSLRMSCTHLIVAFALGAGSTGKATAYLFLKYRASLARRPARASATGELSRPTVDTSLKSTVYAIGRSSLVGEGASTVVPGRREERWRHLGSPALPSSR